MLVSELPPFCLKLAAANPLDEECETEGKVVCHQGRIRGERGEWASASAARVDDLACVCSRMSLPSCQRLCILRRCSLPSCQRLCARRICCTCCRRGPG